MKIIAALMLMTVSGFPYLKHNAERISKTALIELRASIEKVFPLFGPIRETEWAYGWDPEIIFGNIDPEEHMIFRTKAGYDDEKFYTWIVSQYSLAHHKIEYTVSTTQRIWVITVQCTAHGNGTKAMITYTYTSLTDTGAKRNEESLRNMFACDLKDWEEAINFYLNTGKMKKP
jgi:hypothetical protein